MAPIFGCLSYSRKCISRCAFRPSLSQVARRSPSVCAHNAPPLSYLQEDCLLLALPSAPLADIIMRCDVVTRAHIAASCTALLHALLGCEGVHLKLDVTSVNLVRYGWKLRLAWCSPFPGTDWEVTGLHFLHAPCMPRSTLTYNPHGGACRWGERLKAHAHGLHLDLLGGGGPYPEQILPGGWVVLGDRLPPAAGEQDPPAPLPALAPLLCRGVRRLTLAQVGGWPKCMGGKGAAAGLCTVHGWRSEFWGFGYRYRGVGPSSRISSFKH